MNTLYPVFLNIEHRPVLVVGGGTVAEQKIKGLLEACSDVTVIAPHTSETIDKLAGENKISLLRRVYATGDVDGFVLVIAATNDAAVHRAIFDEAQAKNIPVNIVDVPGLCTFFLSSVFQEGDLKIAVSTNGKSPTLGKIIRDRIGKEYSKGYPELLSTLGELRSDIQKSFPDYETRKEYYNRLVNTELDRLHRYSGKGSGGNRKGESSVGKVYLVGAGPGDPELITLKALRILRSADIVLYDALISTELLAEVPEYAEKIYAGKRAGNHSAQQGQINEIMIRKALQGKQVVRLKGGDPMVFGRGGEELEVLQKAGIEVEIVPGITAGTGVPASCGIPLTRRGKSSSVVFITGSEDPSKAEERIDWGAVARTDTIVIYMGKKRLSFIVKTLIERGIAPSKPVAVIFDGTLPQEKIISGTMENIAERVDDDGSSSPGLIIIGSVVENLGQQDHERAYLESSLHDLKGNNR